MPAAVCPSFHCRPSTTSTLLLPSLSIRQTPTTLRNDFGSAPTVSSEKSTFTDCAAPAYVSSAARPRPATVGLIVRLAIFMAYLPPQKFHKAGSKAPDGIPRCPRVLRLPPSPQAAAGPVLEQRARSAPRELSECMRCVCTHSLRPRAHRVIRRRNLCRGGYALHR